MKNIPKIIVLGLIIIFYLVTPSQSYELNKEWIPIKIDQNVTDDGSVIHFPKDVILKSEYVRMEFVGQIKNDSSIPYLIFSVNTCVDCDENRRIVILKPEKDILKDTIQLNYPTEPGNIYSFGPDSKIIYRVRMFLGNCIAGHKEAAVWFISSKQEDGKWKDKVLIAEEKESKLISYYANLPLSNIEDTLLLMNEGKCAEVPGQDITEGP
jgi:hypothetical protein